MEKQGREANWENVECLLLDNRGKYTSNKFTELCKKDGIERNCTVPKT